MTLDPATLQAHLDRLAEGPRAVTLDRHCRLGDGIGPLPTAEPDLGAAPITTFVPASGAATRLFGPLRSLPGDADLDALRERLHDGETALAPAVRALEGWSDLALSHAITGDPEADLPGLLRALHASGIAEHPKGLVPFHLHGEDWRTAIDGHLREAAALVSGLDDVVRVHLTAPAAHLDAFREAVDAAAARVQTDLGVPVRIDLSTQDPSTDTPALGPDGQPLLRDGQPLLRPGGHGALLGNLARVTTPVAVLKNIDNVVHADHRAPVVAARRHLLAALGRFVDEHRAALATLAAGDPVGARAWLAALGLEGPDTAEAVAADLDRPLRVVGVVPNAGHPGGGPFQVRGADGRTTPQIVEGVEVDTRDPAQRAAWSASTHFNPVDLACWLHDAHGRPHDLRRFVDDTRWIVTTRTVDGVTARVLERPGLWNGAMSGWLTRMVELPAATFQPVKTLADLLAPAHRPAATSA